jgi:hypothetical protein
MELDVALARASQEIGLQDYYRDMVRPLLSMPRQQWPGCCGGGCEPCAQTLVKVAELVLAWRVEARGSAREQDADGL